MFAEFTGSSLFTTEKIRHFDEKSLFGGCVSIFEQVSEYKFVYDSDAVKQFQPVSVDLKGVGLEEVLEDCLKGSPFVFLIEDDLVIIREQKSVPQKQTQEVKLSVR